MRILFYCFSQISQNLLSYLRTEDSSIRSCEKSGSIVQYILVYFKVNKVKKSSYRAVIMVCSIDDIVSRRPGKHTRFPTVIDCSLFLFVVFFNSLLGLLLFLSLSLFLSHLL